MVQLLAISALRFGHGVHPAGLKQLKHKAQSPLSICVGTISPARRDHSSSSRSEQDGERKWKLLYHREASRSKYPRAFLGVSTFNLAYWTWYTLDFAPSINASVRVQADLGQIDPKNLELMLIDPKMGYVGLGIATAIWLGSYFYAKQLVSAIWAADAANDEGEGPLAVSTLKMPFATPPKILKDINFFSEAEDMMFSDSELNSEASVEVFAPGRLALLEEKRRNDVLGKFGGDFSKLRGHIALGEEEDEGSQRLYLLQQKYLLDIASAEEIMPHAADTLLRSLVLKDYHLKPDKKGGFNVARNGGRGVRDNSGDEPTGASGTKIRSFAKRKKAPRRRRK